MHDGLSVHAVFCDDVRPEMDGKATLVGVHMQGVTVNGTAPAGLPQLWLALWVTYPTSSMPETIRIVAKGDSLESQPFDITLHPRQEAEAEGDTDTDAGETVTEFIVNRWTPIFFKQDGTLTVEVSADGMTMFTARFPVTITPSPDPRVPPAIGYSTSQPVVS